MEAPDLRPVVSTDSVIGFYFSDSTNGNTLSTFRTLPMAGMTSRRTPNTSQGLYRLRNRYHRYMFPFSGILWSDSTDGR